MIALHNGGIRTHLWKQMGCVRHGGSPAVNNLLTALTSLCDVLDEWTCGEHVLGRVKEQRRRGKRLLRGHMAEASSSELNVVCSDTPIFPPPLLDQGCPRPGLQIAYDSRTISSVDLS